MPPHRSSDRLISPFLPPQVIEMLSPAIYALINKRFCTEEASATQDTETLGVWVDCWAGCAQVLVNNHVHVSAQRLVRSGALTIVCIVS